MSTKINKGSTLIVQFIPQQYIDGTWQNVVPDTYEAYVENKYLEKIIDITPTELDGVYYVAIDTSDNNLKKNEIYFVTFKWTKDGNTIVQREEITLVSDGGVI